MILVRFPLLPPIVVWLLGIRLGGGGRRSRRLFLRSPWGCSGTRLRCLATLSVTRVSIVDSLNDYATIIAEDNSADLESDALWAEFDALELTSVAS